MTKISMHFVSSTDEPIAIAPVTIQLTYSAMNQCSNDVIMSRQEEFTTDANGDLLVDLLACDRLYHVTVYDTEQETSIHHDFYVPPVNDPDSVFNLTDLIVKCNTSLSSLPYDEVALIKIIAAKLEAQAAAVAAIAAKNAANVSAEAAQVSENNAQASALEAEEFKNISSTKADEAAGSVETINDILVDLNASLATLPTDIAISGVLEPQNTEGLTVPKIVTSNPILEVPNGPLNAQAQALLNILHSFIRKSAPVVSSISGIKLLVKNSLYTKAFSTGYYTDGDGGGGAYYLDIADTVSLDNGITTIVAQDGGRWKLAETQKISLLQCGLKNTGQPEDAANNVLRFQAAINYAYPLGKKLYAPAGVYKFNAGVLKNSDYFGLNIEGDGYAKTIFDYSLSPANTVFLTLEGGSGYLCGAVISGICFEGSATSIATEIDGQCGQNFHHCQFGINAIGILPHNKRLGSFTEYIIASECDFSTTCIEHLVFRRSEGDASFHGTGLLNCTLGEDQYATKPKIRIGGADSTNNAIFVYNSSLSFQIWKNTNLPVIENNSTLPNQSTHGTITSEYFVEGKNVFCSGTNKIHHVGNITFGTSDKTELGSMVLMESFSTNSTGVRGGWGKSYKEPKAGKLIGGANVIAKLYATHQEVYKVFAVFTSNASPWTYAYELTVFCSSLAPSSVTKVATLSSYFAGNHPEPVFSYVNGELIAEQAEWPEDTIECSVSVTQIASSATSSF